MMCEIALRRTRGHRLGVACAARGYRRPLTAARFAPVVDADWLKTKFEAPSLCAVREASVCSLLSPRTKVLDASWYLPREGRNPVAEYRDQHIPSAQFFDINTVSDKSSSLPHMLPSETGFAAAMDALEIESSDHVIVYDGMGLFSAGRAWWMFKVFGHRDVSVLDGGFPAWKAAGLETETGMDLTDAEILKSSKACAEAQEGKTSYPAKLDNKQVRVLEQMRRIIESGEEQVIDTRSARSYNGKALFAPKGVRQGHMPGSLNIPYASFVTRRGRLKPRQELLKMVTAAGVDMNRDVVSTCGSGVSACSAALILDYIGFRKHVAVYDGSWTEWGAQSDTPIEL